MNDNSSLYNESKDINIVSPVINYGAQQDNYAFSNQKKGLFDLDSAQ